LIGFVLDLFQRWDAETIGNIFLTAMVVLLLMGVYAVIQKKHVRFQQFAPNLLTTMGILGTFVGIAVGLSVFDVDAIDKSIPALLSGLTTAFLTSVFGIFFAIIIRSLATWRDTEDDEPDEITPELMYRALTAIQGEAVTTNVNLVKLASNIAGEGDSSVVTQIQKLRMNVDDMGKEVAREFREFAKLVSEISSKTLVAALEEVIKDFNQKLTEQFGDNFKRLDESVKKLVDWQQEYKSQIESLDLQFKESLKGILITRDAIKSVAEHTAKIPESLQSLDKVIRIAREQIEELETRLGAFAEMKDKALTAFPMIQKYVDEVMNQVRDSVKKASNHYEIMLTDASDALSKFSQSGDRLHQKFVTDTGAAIDGAKAAVEGIGDKLQDAAGAASSAAASLDGAASGVSEKMDQTIDRFTTGLERSVQKAFNEQTENMNRLNGGLRETVEQAVDEQNEVIKGLTKSLDDSMQEELQRTLQVMANELAAITGQFTSDYRELTGQMQTVVRQNRKFE
jgi:chromosome segregation ATPase